MNKSIDSEGHKALVQMLIDKRKNAGLKQEELAAAIRQTQPWVAHLESGQRRIDVLEYFTIARVIGFDPVEELKLLDARTNLNLLNE